MKRQARVSLPFSAACVLCVVEKHLCEVGARSSHLQQPKHKDTLLIGPRMPSSQGTSLKSITKQNKKPFVNANLPESIRIKVSCRAFFRWVRLGFDNSEKTCKR